MSESTGKWESEMRNQGIHSQEREWERVFTDNPFLLAKPDALQTPVMEMLSLPGQWGPVLNYPYSE